MCSCHREISGHRSKDSKLSDTIWQTDFSFCQKGDIITGDIITIVLLAYSRNFASSLHQIMYCKSIEFQHEKHSQTHKSINR